MSIKLVPPVNVPSGQMCLFSRPTGYSFVGNGFSDLCLIPPPVSYVLSAYLTGPSSGYIAMPGSKSLASQHYAIINWFNFKAPKLFHGQIVKNIYAIAYLNGTIDNSTFSYNGTLGETNISYAGAPSMNGQFFIPESYGSPNPYNWGDDLSVLSEINIQTSFYNTINGCGFSDQVTIEDLALAIYVTSGSGGVMFDGTETIISVPYGTEINIGEEYDIEL